MPINIEHVLGDNEAIERNFNVLRSLVIDTGGQDLSMRVGVATLTFPGGAPETTTFNVPHNLGKQPIVAYATSRNTNVPVAVVAGFTSTTFPLKGRTTDASLPGAGVTIDAFWIAFA